MFAESRIIMHDPAFLCWEVMLRTGKMNRISGTGLHLQGEQPSRLRRHIISPPGPAASSTLPRRSP